VSSTLKPNERAARRLQDDGHPSDSVTHGVSLGIQHNYHNDPECGQLQRVERTVTTTRRKAKRRDRAPCGVCVLGPPDYAGAAEDAECPLCGEPVGHLAHHLPDCKHARGGERP
jgi:hypothetical protein